MNKYNNTSNYNSIELSDDVKNAILEMDRDEKNSDRRWIYHREIGNLTEREYQLFSFNIFELYDKQNETEDFWLENVNDDKLRAILCQLSDKEKSLLTEIFFNKLEVDEVAKIYDISPSAVYKRLEKLIQKIRELYQQL